MDSSLLDTSIILSEKLQGVTGCTSIPLMLWLSFLSQRYSTLGGSLKFCQGSGCLCMRFHFFIKASFIVDTKGWYCVPKGNISFSSLLFRFRRAAFLWVLLLIAIFLSKLCGYLLSIKRFWNLKYLVLRGVCS